MPRKTPSEPATPPTQAAPAERPLRERITGKLGFMNWLAVAFFVAAFLAGFFVHR